MSLFCNESKKITKNEILCRSDLSIMYFFLPVVFESNDFERPVYAVTLKFRSWSLVYGTGGIERFIIKSRSPVFPCLKTITELNSSDNQKLQKKSKFNN